MATMIELPDVHPRLSTNKPNTPSLLSFCTSLQIYQRRMKGFTVGIIFLYVLQSQKNDEVSPHKIVNREYQEYQAFISSLLRAYRDII